MKRTMREISRLRRCINDLASIMALPAVWVGSDRSRVIGTLLAVSVRMLELDFAYARASDFADESPCEWLQYADSIDHPAEPPEVGRVLEPYLAGEASTANFRISNPVGSGTASIAVFRLGVQNKIGVFVAGSRRSEFPTKIERLLLQVAMNQAAIAIQETEGYSNRKAASKSNRRAPRRAMTVTSDFGN